MNTLRRIARVNKVLALAFWFVIANVSVSQATAQSSEELVRATVEQNVSDLLETFNQEKQYYETDPDRFFREMESALTSIVDFRRIAARVMGKYARKTSKEQRDRFVKAFKTSLFETYTKTLIESGTFEIQVTRAAINTRSDRRARVDLEVVSESGSVYPVTYSMYKTDEGEWLMENGFQGLDGQQMPEMPDEFVELVSQRYIELYEQLIGKPFERADVSDISARIQKSVTPVLTHLLQE